MTIEDIIRSRRAELGITQKDMASRTGRKPSTYNEIENGIEKTSVGTLIDICKVLDMEIIITPKQSIVCPKR